jgi:hypothetical protein
LRQRKDEVAEIAIIRAAHLLVYIDELREIGVPVERALARSRLPPWALDDPDAYVSYALCLEWLAGCSGDMELMEFGFRAARRGSLATLGGPFRRAILGAPTGFGRLQTFVRCAALEDNVLSIRLQPEGDRIRVISTQAGFETNPLISIGEWVDLQGMISIVRSGRSSLVSARDDLRFAPAPDTHGPGSVPEFANPCGAVLYVHPRQPHSACETVSAGLGRSSRPGKSANRGHSGRRHDRMELFSSNPGSNSALSG